MAHLNQVSSYWDSGSDSISLCGIMDNKTGIVQQLFAGSVTGTGVLQELMSARDDSKQEDIAVEGKKRERRALRKDEN